MGLYVRNKSCVVSTNEKNNFKLRYHALEKKSVLVSDGSEAAQNRSRCLILHGNMKSMARAWNF